MQSGASALQSLRGGLADGLVWWRDELAGLVPERVRRQFVGGRPETVLVQVDDGFVVVKDAAASRSTKARESAVLPRPEAITQLVRAARSNAEATVGVRLPADVCFARNVELPVAARNDLRRILDFDLERATPFKHRDVYSAHLVEGDAATKGKLRVRQLVTKREAVDPLVADVRAAGLEVGFVDCWADRPSMGMPINFLEPRGGAESGAAGFFRPTRVLLALALLLVLSALVLTLWGYESALTELQGKTAQARTQAAAVRGVLERSDAAVTDLARLQETKLKRTLAHRGPGRGLARPAGYGVAERAAPGRRCAGHLWTGAVGGSPADHAWAFGHPDRCGIDRAGDVRSARGQGTVQRAGAC